MYILNKHTLSNIYLPSSILKLTGTHYVYYPNCFTGGESWDTDIHKSTHDASTAWSCALGFGWFSQPQCPLHFENAYKIRVE